MDTRQIGALEHIPLRVQITPDVWLILFTVIMGLLLTLTISFWLGFWAGKTEGKKECVQEKTGVCPAAERMKETAPE